MTRNEFYGESCYEKFLESQRWYREHEERCQDKCPQCGLGKDCYAAWADTPVNEEGEVI